ncbi:hypothetical protein [Bordetella petrii]|uniref:hypothetical protein n=1 Tax=Bordetella petrii TaxID=94624 RepID=UPI0037331EDA
MNIFDIFKVLHFDVSTWFSLAWQARLTPDPPRAAHQAPTLIGCFVVKEQVPLTARQLLRNRLAVSAAQKRDYEAFFKTCQIDRI